MVRSVAVSLFLVLTTSFAFGARGIHFQPAINSASGVGRLTYVAVGDFNRDGFPDIAVSSTYNTLAILLGNGDGTFTQSAKYTLDVYVESQLGVADFNGDGILDLVQTAGGLNVPATFAILLGNGDGTFGTPAYYSTDHDGSILSLAMGDLNHDGILDFFLGGNGSSVVVLGTANGGFQQGQDEPASGFGVTLGDFNRDGNLDAAVVAGTYQNLYVLLGNGDGTFRAPVTYSDDLEPLSVTTADFNHDGKLDLATAEYNGVSLNVLWGNGDGTFGTGKFWLGGNSPAAVITADFNRDGNPDLATADYTGGGVSVLGGKGDGTFRIPIFLKTSKNPTFLAASDFNRDGSLDLVVTNQADNTVSVLLNAAGTNVVLSSSMDPSTVGQPVTFSASVTGTLTGGVPTGTVTFKDGSNTLGTATLSNGAGAFTTSNLAHGNHKITAVYSGDSVFNPNQSGVLIQIVK
jgi:hypothetical protein